tara:strand:- start:844 stop:1449 length:606 start_codon:yes stop_codon:yes gene_type:complete
MSFGGGGSAGLTNHVHNNVPLQGGPLDFANDTIASLNVGSTTFSDGAALQELVIGNAGDTMVVNGAGTAPEWGAASGATITVQKISPSNAQTTTATTPTNLTAGSATLPTRTGGQAFMVYQQCIEKSTTGSMRQIFYYNGSTQEGVETQVTLTGYYFTGTNSAIDDLDGGTVQLMWMGDSGTLTLRNSGTQQSYCDLYEVS